MGSTSEYAIYKICRIYSVLMATIRAPDHQTALELFCKNRNFFESEGWVIAKIGTTWRLHKCGNDSSVLEAYIVERIG